MVDVPVVILRHPSEAIPQVLNMMFRREDVCLIVGNRTGDVYVRPELIRVKAEKARASAHVRVTTHIVERRTM
jgi:hypothetical protein